MKANNNIFLKGVVAVLLMIGMWGFTAYHFYGFGSSSHEAREGYCISEDAYDGMFYDIKKILVLIVGPSDFSTVEPSEFSTVNSYPEPLKFKNLSILLKEIISEKFSACLKVKKQDVPVEVYSRQIEDMWSPDNLTIIVRLANAGTYKTETVNPYNNYMAYQYYRPGIKGGYQMPLIRGNSGIISFPDDISDEDLAVVVRQFLNNIGPLWEGKSQAFVP